MRLRPTSRTEIERNIDHARQMRAKTQMRLLRTCCSAAWHWPLRAVRRLLGPWLAVRSRPG